MKEKIFKKIATALLLGLIILIIGIFPASKPNADTGFPSGAITATYDQATGQLNTSGSYTWDLCDSSNRKKYVGFALFINQAFPSSSTPDSNALDGTAMHLAEGGNPCKTNPGSWSDTHTVASAPTSVCVVTYDVEINTEEPQNTGDRSVIGAGLDFNEDNSYHENNDSYAAGDCIVPTVLPASTPTPTPTPTQAPPIYSSPYSPPGSDGLGCATHDCSGNPQGGQVLGASTGPQVLGLSTTSGNDNSLPLTQLFAALALSLTGFTFLKKNA